MSIGFNWFKDYELKSVEYGVIVKYIGGGHSLHSAGNIIKAQNLLEEYGSINIPVVNEYSLKEGDKLDLVDPKEVSKVCQLILNDIKVDEVGMRKRIEWFKELSDKGYYLTYDCD